MKHVFQIGDEKFKSIYLSYNFIIPINKKSIGTNAVLALVLSKSCEKYKTEQEIEQYLSGLYGTNFDVDIQKIGDLLNIEFRMEVLNEASISCNENIVEKAIEFLYEIIYHPNIKNGTFEQSILQREKEFVLDKIRTRKDEKIRYAISRTEELLCEKENFGVYIYGNEQDVNQITNSTLIDCYRELLDKSEQYIIISGNLTNHDNLEQYMAKLFGDRLKNNVYLLPTKRDSSIEKIKEVREEIETNQAVITIGIKVDNYEKQDFYPLTMYNTILGGTPSSKLFQEVREKHSLAYTAKCRYYRFKQIFILYAGIEEKNYEKAKTVMLEQVEAMKNGSITEEEFNCAKQAIISDIKEWKDSKIAMAKKVFTDIVEDDFTSSEQMIQKINQVTIDQVKEIAKKLQVSLIYLLGGNAHE